MAEPLTAAELAYYDINAPLLGFMGAAFALIFSNLGAAYGTGKSGMGISALGVGKPELVMKSIVPVQDALRCRDRPTFTLYTASEAR